MAFSKTFPRTIAGSNYPVWEEIFLTLAEEQEISETCRKENISLLDQSIQDARMLAIKNGMNEDHIVAKLAVALFEKKASHEVFWKESKAKEKFDKKQ